ncbi:transporter [Lentibacillus populi]|uniref:Transporter n=1 Tax=Lentibacillus populi TaxID=1827502 RepID=A0A9W5U159_9BACI|nr:MMPL family transporter [Lentibacillus populi]GGB55949.1 transporter [Lentibacillus populi]
MKHIIKFRWPIAILWVAVAVSLFIFAPNLQELVQEKGQITVPEGYTSQEAQALIEDMSADEDNSSASSVLVFHDNDGLDKAKKEEIAQAIDELKKNQDNLQISDILDFREDPAIADQTVAEDGKTIMVPFQVSLKDQEVNKARDNIYDTVDDINVEHYLTGEQMIQQDILDNSEEGLKKTEFITVGLILIILFVVFKSFVAPFIPLLTVGISYLAAQGIVSILADTAGFPLSTFTQIFMVAVMFGIGTDYCILLISRFKEEIAQHDSIKDAVATTYKSGGKTIFFAGLAVLIGFSTIGLSTFSLYQSAVAVAVGVAVVLIALATLVPFFLVVLGKKLFWPFDKNVAHKESRIWGTAGKFAWGRPVVALVIVAVITLPFLLTFDGDKSYNSLEEIGDDYGSVKGFNWIADSFGPGQTMPTSVVFKTDKPVDSVEDYQAIEDMSQELAQMDGVEQVRSATRPAGDVIEDFKANKQTGMLADGVDQSTEGITKIQAGLQEAASELKKSGPQLKDAQNGVDQLMQGTQEANNGVGDMKDALSQIQQGIESGSQGAGEIKTNLQTIKDNLDQTIAGNRQLLQGYQAIADGLKSVGGGEFDAQGIDELKGAMQGSLDQLKTLQNSNPELNQEQQIQLGTAIQYTEGAIKGIEQLQNKIKDVQGAQTGLQEVNAQFSKLNQGFADSIAGQEKLAAGIGELISGIDQLQSGLNQAADGQGQVVNNIPSLQDGLSQIYGGQEELKTAFSDMQGQLDELTGGLGDSSNGLKKINDGLSKVQDHLSEFDADSSKPIVIIPEEALENEDFIEGTKAYLSDDKTIVKFDVVLSHNPYSTKAINMVDKIKDTVNNTKEDTVLAGSDPKLGGVSSTNNDLQNISDADYSRTVFLMIAGIFIILVLLLRSLIMPLYLIGSLILTYFTSMGVAELVFNQLLGYDGLTWAIPFFSFVMLMALGIDYSIFVMDRFNEYKNGNIKEALLSAMKNMGTVIISAAIILGGTFGAMLPSGVLSILQIATVVLTGLFLYAFVMLPLFIPVMVRIFGKVNWWPFKYNKE